MIIFGVVEVFNYGGFAFAMHIENFSLFLHKIIRHA